MRLQLILPQLKPTVFTQPVVCPHEGCPGRHFEHHQEVEKALKDTAYSLCAHGIAVYGASEPAGCIRKE
jgi:hypothetical protein